MEESVKQCGYDTWEELNKSMSPSRFTKKMHPDVVISHHMESVAKGKNVRGYLLYGVNFQKGQKAGGIRIM